MGNFGPYAIRNAILSAGLYISDAIACSTVEDVNGAKEIASENRKENYANTKMMVDAILSGSSYVERGLLQIASELRYSNVLTERRDLEAKINSIEDWLYDKGFLKDFYQTAEMSKKIVPLVNASHIPFLEEICRNKLSEDDNRELQKGCSAEEFQRKLEVTKNELCKYSMNMMCHPLVTLAYLISKNSIGQTGLNNFYIGGTSYKWPIYSRSYTLRWQDSERVFDFGEYEIVFKKQENICYAELTFEEALRHLVHVATEFEKTSCLEKIKVRLEWESFFAELNMHIAMYNLRVLAQSLEAFKRQKQLQLLE